MQQSQHTASDEYNSNPSGWKRQSREAQIGQRVMPLRRAEDPNEGLLLSPERRFAAPKAPDDWYYW